jgi:phospholipase C
MRRLKRRKWISAMALGAMLSAQLATPLAFAQSSSQAGSPGGSQSNSQGSNDGNTATPIKHVVLIIGENRTFDNVFGTFKPNPGQTVWNLASEGIVMPDGQPGPNADAATQYQATDNGTYSISPTKASAYSTLPDPNVGGPTAPFFSTAQDAMLVEPALPQNQYWRLTVGGTGLTSGSVDTRFTVNGPLPNDPFDITDFIPYTAYAGSPVHRFFQMWQQLDCDVSKATVANPSGCQADLFPWVEETVATGTNGKGPSSLKPEGAIAMGFYNNRAGDVSYFNDLAHNYALSDNYHQAIMGGTGANHIAIGYGQTIFYADSNGNPATPPSKQIENPDPQSGTNNLYSQDGYSGGSYVNCADNSQPGVASVMDYLNSLPFKPWNDGNCQQNAYYLVNNYNPGYLGDGTPAPLGSNQFTIPPSQEPNLGTLLTANNVSWRYYGEGWDSGKEDGEQVNGNGGYCNICNPFLYSTQIMTDPTQRANLKDIQDLYSDIQNDSLPAVSIVKPDGFLDGHPSSSRFDLFEQFCHKIIDMAQANQQVWKDTAIVITVDEGGGYYDSGYVQPIDFFGDGTRIPMLVVSKFSQTGSVVHTYYDHVSFDKFVEANWKLSPISSTGRDNLPNPVASADNPYVPSNSPAIGDLMDMFKFGNGADSRQKNQS